MLYRLKREFFDKEDGEGNSVPKKGAKFENYYYFRNFLFSDSAGLAGMKEFFVVSHPAFSKRPIQYKENELRGTRYKFDEEYLEVYTDEMRVKDEAEKLEKKYKSIVNTSVKRFKVRVELLEKWNNKEVWEVKAYGSFILQGELYTVGPSITYDVKEGIRKNWRIGETKEYYHYETGINCGTLGKKGKDYLIARVTELKVSGMDKLLKKYEKINLLPGIVIPILDESRMRAITAEMRKEVEEETMTAEKRKEVEEETMTAEKRKKEETRKKEVIKRIKDNKRAEKEKKKEPREDISPEEIQKILISEVTKYDREQRGKPGYNPHALAMYFDSVYMVIKRCEEGDRIDRAINEFFNNPIAGRLKRVLLSYLPRPEEGIKSNVEIERKSKEPVIIPEYDSETDTAPEIPEYNPEEGE